MSLHFISLLNSLLIFGQPPTRPACHSLPGLLLILCGCAVSQVFLCQSVVLSFEDSVIPVQTRLGVRSSVPWGAEGGCILDKRSSLHCLPIFSLARGCEGGLI